MSKNNYKTQSKSVDSSSDFFQSKHISKRKEDFEKQLLVRKQELLTKLKIGLDRTETAYESKTWRNEYEEAFLEAFSLLKVDSKLINTKKRLGYFLLDECDEKVCFYNLRDNTFILDYYSFWTDFMDLFGVENVNRIQTFFDRMIRKYFKMDVSCVTT